MSYAVRFTPKAAKQVKTLDPVAARRIRLFMEEKLQPLENPRLLGKKLINEDFWRYRVGGYGSSHPSMTSRSSSSSWTWPIEERSTGIFESLDHAHYSACIDSRLADLAGGSSRRSRPLSRPHCSPARRFARCSEARSTRCRASRWKLPTPSVSSLPRPESPRNRHHGFMNRN